MLYTITNSSNLTCYTITHFACQFSVSNAKMQNNVVSNQQCWLRIQEPIPYYLLTHLLKQWHQSNRPSGETSSFSTVILIITSSSFGDNFYYWFFLQIHCGFGEWLLVNLSAFSNIWNGTIIVWGYLTLWMPLNLIYVLETVKILWRSKFLSMFSSSENSLPSERWTLFSVCISHHWPSP